ncbi:MAG TPA: hypothetical protein DCG90_00445 [Sphingobium sp.]|uniref:hypothetical protein n=1 Tax=unclassified Sphingobium TaxID=2611147 RepID=UPI000EDF02CF|nr:MULTISPECIES: hypothetical protein [unclassified Sphingobium]WIW87256.1 hypothetical protein K3M67_09650 [Sphingobium sp. V4]HAF40237.1 hypothetical protein [Sphingobium sp.]
MKSVSSAILGAIAFACAPSIHAQVTTAPAAPVATIIATPGGNILRAGSQLSLRTAEPLTTEGKKLRIGQRVQLEVAEAVMLNGQTVIPLGSPVVGEITDVRNKGMWGKSGRINGRVLYVRANGTQIRLTGSFDDKGVTGTAGVVAAIAFVPVAGFFTTGTSAKIPLGAPVSAFLDEDISVAFAPSAAPATPVAAVPAATPAAAPAPAPAPTKTSLVDPSLEIKATN